ncbi:MAG: vitamin K epoxide reductase family protein [Nitrososphaerales archaeon]
MTLPSKFRNLSPGAKAYLILSGLGIAVAIYHSYDELTASFNSCNVSSKISCGGVFESGHASLFGVPFYVLGLVWFPLVLVLGIVAAQRVGSSQVLNGRILLTFLMIGNIFTIYLWYLELVVIGIVCPVCVSLYLINYALTGLALWALL